MFHRASEYYRYSCVIQLCVTTMHGNNSINTIYLSIVQYSVIVPAKMCLLSEIIQFYFMSVYIRARHWRTGGGGGWGLLLPPKVPRQEKKRERKGKGKER